MSKPQWFVEHEEQSAAIHADIRNDLKDIKENHLVHIQLAQERLVSDFTWVKWFLTGIIGGIGTIAITYLMK